MDTIDFEKVYDMNTHPTANGWVLMLHNKRLDSVGNDYYAQTMWYDLNSDTLSSSEDSTDKVSFDKYMLPEDGGMPLAWKYTKNI